MDTKIVLETFLNAMDIGKVFESATNYRKRTWKVSFREIMKRLITGKGYTNLSPPQTSRLLWENKDEVHIFDLRDVEAFGENHIYRAINKPIDDFLKEVFVGTYSTVDKDTSIVLVCDTGQLSKVAASVMAEQGYTRVYSIKGGMRRWNRWMKLSNNNRLIGWIPSCCNQISE